ncbi:SPOR domain-containing protein [Demequina muriae]|uniref:SPOR domain-containing protein n=1 Tax=Demequina muriae TaxID=3051664 RepID=A0ABT8GKQ5_9MICO|nr:SPOR domain-containing protein [Demequina sp. EGI L300058]MDN4481516.1 SPOR domain-containing protein [Demequina sp. EGI L300058]
MSPDKPDEVEYFFNTRTRMVEKGRVSSWEHLMGPYPTRGEAEKALAKAEARAEAWDEADHEWKGDD